MGFLAPLSFLRDIKASKEAAGASVMLHTGRVGSTVVARMLEQHPDLRWDGEVFESRLPSKKRALKRRSRWLRREILPPLLDLRSRLGRATREGFHYGFESKHHFDQHGFTHGLPVGALVEELSRMGFEHFIEVRRENYLRQVISVIRMRQGARAHARVGEQVELSALVVNPQAVPLGRAHLPLRERFAQFDTLHEETIKVLEGRRYLSLTYERDIERDPTNAYNRICEFIGLRPVTTQVTLRRTNDAPLRSLIANFDEVADELAGTQYEWMLGNEQGAASEAPAAPLPAVSLPQQ